MKPATYQNYVAIRSSKMSELRFAKSAALFMSATPGGQKRRHSHTMTAKGQANLEAAHQAAPRKQTNWWF